MELAGITGPGTAFVAGLVTSLHCAGMCGPLACALLPGARDRHDPQTVAATYHLTRLAGYAVLGALAGGLGRVPLTFLGDDAVRYLPWLLVLFFIAVAVRFDQRLPRLPLLGRAYGWMAGRLRGRSRLSAAAGLGFATPLLPLRAALLPPFARAPLGLRPARRGDASRLRSRHRAAALAGPDQFPLAPRQARPALARPPPDRPRARRRGHPRLAPPRHARVRSARARQLCLFLRCHFPRHERRQILPSAGPAGLRTTTWWTGVGQRAQGCVDPLRV
jgi:hypothetical protein